MILKIISEVLEGGVLMISSSPPACMFVGKERKRDILGVYN